MYLLETHPAPDLCATAPLLSAHLFSLIKIVDSVRICLKSDFSLKQIQNPSCFIFFFSITLYEVPFHLLPKKLIMYILDSSVPSPFVQCVLNTDISLKVRNRFMDTLKL